MEEVGLRERLIAGTAAAEGALVSGWLVGAFWALGAATGDGVDMKALSRSGYSKLTVEKQIIISAVGIIYDIPIFTYCRLGSYVVLCLVVFQ